MDRRYPFVCCCGIALIVLGALTSPIAIAAGALLLLAAGIGIGAERRRG